MTALSNLLRSYVATQIAEVRNMAKGVMLLLTALFVVLFGIAFAFFAAFLALSDFVPQWQAALIVAAVACISAFFLRLAGMRLVRRRARVEKHPVRQESKTATDALALSNMEVADAGMLLVLAALAGIVIGRRISR